MILRISNLLICVQSCFLRLHLNVSKYQSLQKNFNTVINLWDIYFCFITVYCYTSAWWRQWTSTKKSSQSSGGWNPTCWSIMSSSRPKRHSEWNSAALVPVDLCPRRCTLSPSAARVAEAGAWAGAGLSVKIGGCTQKAWTPALQHMASLHRGLGEFSVVLDAAADDLRTTSLNLISCTDWMMELVSCLQSGHWGSVLVN